jgi:hypothetical protein
MSRAIHPFTGLRCDGTPIFKHQRALRTAWYDDTLSAKRGLGQIDSDTGY